MRNLDRALARLYQRDDARHDLGAPGPLGGAGFDADPILDSKAMPPPHFAVPDVPTVALCWPATVRALEREHGRRFELLADHLIEARDQRNVRVLLFTSCNRAEGRTTLVLTVARALARRDGRTLLVDGDLSGPMLARLLGLRPRVGLDDVVLDGLSLDEATIEAPDDHLSILPLRAPVARPREFLAEAGWTCALARLRREYDLVIIDGSPLFTGLSAAVLHRSVDAAVLVHHRTLTGERSLLRAREILEAGGVTLLGLAETFV